MLRTVLFVLLAFLGAGVPTAALAAESPTPTRQQVAMNAAWLSHLAPEDLPPVDQRGIVCLVDSGVDITPDLPADRPEGPVVSRQVSGALTRGGDTADGRAGPSYAAQHGTRMASFIAATSGNDWGSVGQVPWVRVLSVRAMPKDSTAFPRDGHQAAIRSCQRLKDSWPALTVVNLSYGCGCTLGEGEQAMLDDAWASADSAGLVVVAAAGNRSSASLDSPASTNGVLAISAGDQGGGRCPFSNWSETALSALGCGLDAHDGFGTPVSGVDGGTSAAAATTSAVVAALRSLRPELTPRDAVVALRRASNGGRIDVEAAARAVALGPVVDRALARAGAAAAVPATAAPVAPRAPESETRGDVAVERTTPPKALRRPAIAVRRRGRALVVTVKHRPPGALVDLRLGGRAVIRQASRLTVRSRVRRLRARLIDDQRVSPFTSATVPRR